MTVKAVCCVTAMIADGSNPTTRFGVSVSYVGLAAPFLNTGVGNQFIDNLDPEMSGARITAAIEEGMQTYFAAHGMVFTASDSVRLIV